MLLVVCEHHVMHAIVSISLSRRRVRALTVGVTMFNVYIILSRESGISAKVEGTGSVST
jgi:hypothetical protein